jgi:hypothetical protein
VNGNQALTEFERRLIAVRSTAGAGEAWSAYKADVVPQGMEPGREALIGQGFDAGYAAAMKCVADRLADVQTMALRDKPEGLRAKADELIAFLDEQSRAREGTEATRKIYRIAAGAARMYINAP